MTIINKHCAVNIILTACLYMQSLCAVAILAMHNVSSFPYPFPTRGRDEFSRASDIATCSHSLCVQDLELLKKAPRTH